ncbi:16S rRNA (cytosine(967)-C(5))-methyltransferase RsmB [Mechercharimyces sp. CAU 1602]|uniref:16S rRNA (cytosine(967)-C(5))-methyltransferase RsmB n=1 Tax=Mechercharimyces sp. CAU 1602 TaxID=2973933 RepID=UPI00216153EF|nr:16S rRNA (cytosine(967)-C(5))-methyltransferase RsmB [Mechercharimyces sp. CAU 1602]MCS1351395.1 16S rRNA (cytosine(967)-C(5))-methyltransferase RsmB [Mechercharimyces sp. CAU 1602]
MKKVSTAREVALDVLIGVEEKNAYSNLLLNEALQTHPLSGRDRGLVTELVYGSIQRLNTLDWLLNHYVKKGVDSLEGWVRQLLRMGMYQLHYLERIPERAAVNEAVHIAKKRGHKGVAGLVNGVLRSYLRQPPDTTRLTQPQSIQDWALATSHPEWMVRRFQSLYGIEETATMLKVNNLPPAVGIRANALKKERDVLLDEMKEAYPEATILTTPLSPEGIVFTGGGNPAHTDWFKAGECTIQNPSSMLVTELLQPQPGQLGLDACAAPGGKTTHIAEKMGGEGKVYATDLHRHKVELIRKNAMRLGLSNIEAVQADARELPQALPTLFDFILLDAPCSGLGVIRRKPDLKWQKSGAELKKLCRLQAQLLEETATRVRPGGVLLYSTCTLEASENEEQVRHFLENHPEFTLDTGMNELLPREVREKGSIEPGMVRILPHQFASDGFFIARMVKHK